MVVEESLASLQSHGTIEFGCLLVVGLLDAGLVDMSSAPELSQTVCNGGFVALSMHAAGSADS